MRLLDVVKGGLIVSCYAGEDINELMAEPVAMACVARSVMAGGAAVVRTNLENVSAVKEAVGPEVPVIGIKKIYKEPGSKDFRITPTMAVVDAQVAAGADAIAVDGTRRPRYDELTLAEFLAAIKGKYPDLPVVADISTVEEGVAAWEAGADFVGTTLSGYTPYSKNPIAFGTLPSPDPDYEIISELRAAGVEHVVAEGRITDGHKMRRCLDAGADCVVIGTSITEPRKIVKTILMDASEGGEQ